MAVYFFIIHTLRLVGCLNNKVGSTSLTQAFLQLKLGKLEDDSLKFIWNHVGIVQPENNSLEKYISKESEYIHNHTANNLIVEYTTFICVVCQYCTSYSSVIH